MKKIKSSFITSTTEVPPSPLPICKYCKKLCSGQPDTFCRARLTINKKRAERQQQQPSQFQSQAQLQIEKPKQKKTQIIKSRGIPTNIIPICKGGFSRIYSAELISDDDNNNNPNVILKVLKYSRNFGEQHLQEFIIHHLCHTTCAIPFYGLTKGLKNNRLDYAMVMKKAKYGDLRDFLNTVNDKNNNIKFDWKDKITLLLEISKSLKTLHGMDILHRDFHCKNIFVDENFKIYIGDFGLSCREENSKNDSLYLTQRLDFTITDIIDQDSKQNNTDSLYLTQRLNFDINDIINQDSKQNNTDDITTNSNIDASSNNHSTIGVCRLELIGAKDLKCTDFFLAGGKSDPYVRVFHKGGKDIIAQTKVIENKLNPNWNEIHYLPVQTIGDKFILEVMDFNKFIKDKPLGICHFEVTRELVNEVSEDVFEGTPNGIDVWAKLSIKGELNYKAKFFALTPLPDSLPDFLSNLKEKPFDRSTLFVLITLQAPDGSFPPSNTLASLFGYSNPDELLEFYKKNCRDDLVLKINSTVWTTSMVLWFLRYLLKEFRKEWAGVFERAKQYISKEINSDLEIEEIVFAIGRKAVRERFDIKFVDTPYPSKRNVTRENISVAQVKRIIKFQNANGSYKVNDGLAKSLSFDNAEQLRTALNAFIRKNLKSASITQLDHQVLVTILVIYFYRYVAIDHKKEWVPTYEKSYKWLWGQFKGKEKVEQEGFQIIKSFVRDVYEVEEGVYELDATFEVEMEPIISNIKFPNISIYGIVKKPLGVLRIEIISAKKLKKADYLFGTSDPYVKISSVSTGWAYGETRVVYNNLNPTWNQVFYITIHEIKDKFKLQVFDYNFVLKHTPLGNYILDLKDIVKILANGSLEGKKLGKQEVDLTLKGRKYGMLSFFVEFNSFSEAETSSVITTKTVNIRHLYLITSYQRQDGCFELTDKTAKLFNFSSKQELIKAFSNFVANDDGVRYLKHNVWSTCLIISFFKTLLWKYHYEWIAIHNKGEAWLSDNVPDNDIEERLYSCVTRFIIQHFNITEWESESQRISLGVDTKISIIVRSKANIRIVRRFITYQNDSGCFVLSDKSSGSFGFSSIEEAKKHLEIHFSSYSKASKLDVHVWNTAIFIWYFRLVLIDFRTEWTEVFQKSESWISEQVPDEQTRIELMDAAKIFVIKRFQVGQSSIDEDNSLRYSRDSIVQEPLATEDDDDDIIASEEVIGVIRFDIKSAKDLKKSWFMYSHPDPYVRILNSTSKEIGRTITINGTNNPTWNEFFLVPIHRVTEKITFEINDYNIFVSDTLLGTYVFESSFIVEKKDDGSLISEKVFDQQVPLQLDNKPVKGSLDLCAKFFSSVFNSEENFVFSQEAFTLHHLYIIFGWRLSSGAFTFSENLARFLNLKNEQELVEKFKQYVATDQYLLKCDMDVWSTAIVITYLRIICWKYYSEWKTQVSKSEKWLNLQIDDTDVEDRLYEACKKFIIEVFKITSFEDDQLKVLTQDKKIIVTRKNITVRFIRRIVRYQAEDGSIALNEKVVNFYWFESEDEFIKYLKNYFKTERVTKLHINVWITACTILYLRLVAIDHSNEWSQNYEKSYEWLVKQCKEDTELVNEILECAKKFVVERYQVNKEAEEADSKF
ncbi:5967_t:CDS:10, partial [Diversispora eburnea]